MKTNARRVALISTACLLLPLSAVAQTTVPPVEIISGNSVRVSYADLDTGTAPGMRSLTQRVNRAAVAVCRYEHGRGSLALVEFACRDGAREDAWAQFARNGDARTTIELVMAPRRSH